MHGVKRRSSLFNTDREPDDFVVATGEMHSVRDFVEAAFAEVELLLGDPSKAKEKLGREAYLKDGGYEVERYHE